MALNQPAVDTWLIVNATVAAPISLGIGIANATKLRVLSEARRTPFQVVLLQSTLVLAACTVVAAILGVLDQAGGEARLFVFDLHDLGKPTQPHKTIRYPSVPGALVFTVAAGMALGIDAYITWQCYLLGKSIAGEAVPRWKMVLAQVSRRPSVFCIACPSRGHTGTPCLRVD